MMGDQIYHVPAMRSSAGQSFLTIFSFLFFWPHHMAYGILVPKPRMEPIHPAMETQSLNHWAVREIREKSLVVESDP